MHHDMLVDFGRSRPIFKNSLTEEEKTTLCDAMHILNQIADPDKDAAGPMASEADPIGLLLENFISKWRA